MKSCVRRIISASRAAADGTDGKSASRAAPDGTDGRAAADETDAKSRKAAKATDKAKDRKELPESGTDHDTSYADAEYDPDIDAEYDEATEKLMKVLKAWRKMKYEELHLPAFMIMHQKVLVQIAEEKPSTKEELMQINGFGKRKWEKYGQEILDIIEEYHN